MVSFSLLVKGVSMF